MRFDINVRGDENALVGFVWIWLPKDPFEQVRITTFETRCRVERGGAQSSIWAVNLLGRFIK